MTAGERLGFCQNCGRPLDQQTIRAVGPAVYCEPCLEARLSGTIPTPNQPGAAQVPPYARVYSAPPSGTPVPSSAASLPNPTLAGVLGCIPGVGAMYNGQYAKGIVHLMVFAVLVSLTNASDIFSLFVMGWIGYMVIEAHHTAKARRDGTPLPNPFGLNDLSERLGFGKAWPGGATHSAPTQAGTPYYTPDFAAPPPASVPYPSAATPWTPESVRVATQPSMSGPEAIFGFQPAHTVPFTPPPYAPPTREDADAFQTVPPGSPVDAYPGPTVRGRRFPIGAIWLIGLGLFFFLATTGLFHGLPARAMGGFAFIGLGVWLFLRRLVDTSGSSMGDERFAVRIARALRASTWVTLVGVLFLLDEFGILGWNRSWPLFIIMAGVVTLAERIAHNLAGDSRAVAFGGSPSQPSPPTPDPLSERRF